VRSRFAPDRALNLRMVATAFLLGLLFVTFTAVLIALIKSAVVAVVWPVRCCSPSTGFPTGSPCTR